MTLCMAAVCYDYKLEAHRIVFGSDRRVEVSWAGGDVGFKFGWARKNWPALIAGNTSKAHDFLATCRAGFINDPESFTRDNIFDKFNAISSAHKEKLCQRYTHQRYGITFERALTKGEAELPADVRTRLFYELAGIEFDCEVLVFGFTERIVPHTGETMQEPHIIEIQPDGEVLLHHGFAAIGTGSTIAKSTFYQREQSAGSSLQDTVYCLYEAARLAHKTAPGVGEISQFQVLDPPVRNIGIVGMVGTSFKCLKVLEEVFEVAGPKPFIPIAILDESHFDKIIPPPEEEFIGEEGPVQPSDEQTSEDRP